MLRTRALEPDGLVGSPAWPTKAWGLDSKDSAVPTSQIVMVREMLHKSSERGAWHRVGAQNTVAIIGARLGLPLSLV